VNAASRSRLRRVPDLLFALALLTAGAACASAYVVGDLPLREFYIGLFMFGWISLPWTVYLLLARTAQRPVAATVTGLAMTALYAYVYVRVFFFPAGSTDAIAIAIVPLVQYALIAGGEVIGRTLKARRQP